MKTKICNHCNEELLISEFGRVEGGKYGVRGTCLKCRVIKQSIYNANNIPKRRKYLKKYYKEKPYAKKLCCIRSRCNYVNGWYYINGIKNFLNHKDIEYLWFRDKAYELKQPSIDRIDARGHYTLENCRFIELKKNTRGKGRNNLKRRKI